MGLGVEHFTLPAHAYVLDDRISLKRRNPRDHRSVTDTRQRLPATYRAQGPSEGDAMLRSADDLRTPDFYPGPESLTARPVAAPPICVTIFEISRRAFDVGRFQDTGKAIRNPGTPVEKNVGKYIRHRDFDTSEKLNRFLQDGGIRFFVKSADGTYEIEITPRRAATR